MHKFLKNRIIYIILVLSLVMLNCWISGDYSVSANTPEPTKNAVESTTTPAKTTDNADETGTPIATATPQPQNMINSIGDFELYGEYIDGKKVEENVAINGTVFGEEIITEEIISAVRAQNGNQDIFKVIGLELLQNGRPFEQSSPIKVHINSVEIFDGFENISLYKIVDNQNIMNVTTITEENYIVFEAEELGKYVVCGEKIIIDATAEPMETTKPLQEPTDAGIITTNVPTKVSDETEDGLLSPGAFVFWLIVALVIGLWIGLGIGYILWGRYKSKKNYKGPFVIGE